VIGLRGVDPARLPDQMAISALTLAELSRGPAVATEDALRALRQQRLQLAEAAFEALDFDSACARAYGRVCAAVVAVGRKAGRTRAIDLMIAATALANELPLLTLDPDDVRGLEDLIRVIDLS